MDGTVPVWLAILGTFLGYAVAFGSEYLRGRQTLTREREARKDARQAAREDARDAFERETLLQLQDAVGALMRNTARVQIEDEKEYRRTGKWGRLMLPEDLGGEPTIQLSRDVQRLRVRLLDDRLRAFVEQWSSLAAAATVGAMREEPDAEARARSVAAWSRCTDLYLEMAEAIGERLRMLIAHWSDE
jgi:hypothetical protein